MLSAGFDCGNILTHGRQSKEHVLTIKPDPNTSSFQWFYFSVSNAKGIPHKIRIMGLGQSYFPSAWVNYEILTSDDLCTWNRLKCEYNGDFLRFEKYSLSTLTYFSLFVPYLPSRLIELLYLVKQSACASWEIIGSSCRGRNIALISVGNCSDRKPAIWIIARQHPGESMAAWCIDAFVRRLISLDDAKAQQLRELASIYIVPDMNPDGVALGNHRNNAIGVDLNRSWNRYGIDAAEVATVRNRIAATNISMFLDVHGDEMVSYPYFAKPCTKDGVVIKSQQSQIEDVFKSNGVPVKERPPFDITPCETDLGISMNYIHNLYDCLALTIELPFQQRISDCCTDYSPHKRCSHFGHVLVDALISALN